MNEYLAALRELRAIPIDDPSLAERALGVVASVTGSTVLSLRPPTGEAVTLVGPLADGHEVTRFEHIVPTRFGSTVITLERPSSRPFAREDLATVEMLGGEIALLLQLRGQLAPAPPPSPPPPRATDLEVVNEIGMLVAQQLELRSVLATAATELAHALDVSRVHVFLADAEKTQLSGVACSPSADVDADLAIPIDASTAVAEAFRRRIPIVVDDAVNDPRANPALVARLGTRSFMVVPLMSGEEAIGVIVVIETRHVRPFSASEVARVAAVASLVPPAITNAKRFDALRRSFETLAREQADLIRAERLSALGELSGVIAHEVRNPVAVIFNSIAELRRGEAWTEDTKALLAIVEEEATRLNRIVGALLDYVRPYTVHPQRVKLDALLASALSTARENAAVPKVNVDVDGAQLPSEAIVDGTMLQQALVNLIVNAIQATPSGKTVTVRAHVVSDANGQARLRCTVSDQGPGIDGESSSRVFQPFFTTKPTGTGLGLALARRLVGALGGSIDFENARSGGASFMLTVPIELVDGK